MTPARMPDKRHAYGPRTLGALMPLVTRSGFARHPAATAQVIADWALIAGEHLAAITQPRRLSGGTLTVACPGPAALELQHAGGLLIERINTHLGHTTVLRLRIVQDPLAAGPPRPVAWPQPSAADHAAVDRQLADVPAGGLRDALAALGMALRRSV